MRLYGSKGQRQEPLAQWARIDTTGRARVASACPTYARGRRMKSVVLSLILACAIATPALAGCPAAPLGAPVVNGIDTIEVCRAGYLSLLDPVAKETRAVTYGLPPPRPKASPIFNFRSEGRRFADSKRCLVPASAFFEFTGTKYPKAKHRFTLNDAPFMAIAGLWRDGQGNGLGTCSPTDRTRISRFSDDLHGEQHCANQFC